MYICKKCRRVHLSADKACKCGSKRRKAVDHINTPVFLTATGRIERELINGALKDAQIPFEERQSEKNLSDDLITGHDLHMSGYDILVPYSAIPKSFDILNGIGVTPTIDESLIESIQKDIELKKQEIKEANEMSPAKRTTVKIISAIIFLLVLALVVLGTDKIMELIKGLFAG